MTREERTAFVRGQLIKFVSPEVRHLGAVQKAIADVTEEIVDRWEDDLVESAITVTIINP